VVANERAPALSIARLARLFMYRWTVRFETVVSVTLTAKASSHVQPYREHSDRDRSIELRIVPF
jgi:hypothetical protein